MGRKFTTRDDKGLSPKIKKVAFFKTFVGQYTQCEENVLPQLTRKRL